MRRIAFALVVAVVGLACKRAPNIHIDASVIKDKIMLRVERVISRPAVDDAFDHLLGGLGADPAVLEPGTALLGTLTADPTISQAGAHIIAAVQAKPDLQELVVELVRSHPGATPDQIGELASNRFETNWKSQPINAAWMRAWNRLLPKFEFGAMPRIFESTLGKRFDAYLDAREGRWTDRLIALNGGRDPGSTRASELYVDHAWSEERLERFLVTVLENPRFQRECASVVHRLLQVEALQRALREAAVAFVADATVQDAAIDVVHQLMRKAPSADVVGRDLDRLLQTPVTASSLNKLVTRVLAEPEIPRILVEAFDHLSADKQLGKALDELLDGW